MTHTQSVGYRISRLQSQFSSLRITNGPSDEATLQDCLSAHGLLVLPAVERFQCSTEKNLQGVEFCHTCVEVIFTFLDTATGENESMRTVGTSVVNGAHVQGLAIQAATQNALLHLFYKGLPAIVVKNGGVVGEGPNKVQVLIASTEEAAPNASLTTADQLPEKPTKKQLADDSHTLLSWQNAIDNLSAENPGDWDNHLATMKKFTFIKGTEKLTLFESMKAKAQTSGLGWNDSTKTFYLLDIPAL